MKAIFSIFISWGLAVCLTGCTSMQLKKSTIAQGQTLTDLEYTMFLDNIAMQKQLPGALPWHLKVTQGSIGINDSVSPSFTYTWGSSLSRALGLSASRGWQESWTVVPEIDSGHLYNLQKVYAKYANTNWIQDGFPAIGTPSGHYGTKTVWVKPQDIGKLTDAVIDVLVAAPVSAGDRGIILPGPPGH
jgi:hypothetical protein